MHRRNPSDQGHRAVIRPNESIRRLKNDVAAHEITEQAVHYYGTDSKEHGTDIEKLLAYVEQLEAKTLLAVSRAKTRYSKEDVP